MTGDLISHTCTQGTPHMNVKAEIKVMDLQAKECQRRPTNSQNWERGLEDRLPAQSSERADLLFA